MSRTNSTFVENPGFVTRFIEVCGTSKPSEIARLLNVSSQSAKNYLTGRLPSSYVLRFLAQITPYSINWLLTGEGEKIIKSDGRENPPILSDEMRQLVREVCMEVIETLSAKEEASNLENVVILSSDKIRKEKIIDASEFSEK